MATHIPAAIIALAKMIRVEGWRVSVIIAMSLLETDRWRSTLFKVYSNAFGLKASEKPENAKWEGPPVVLGGHTYATFPNLRACFYDLRHTLQMQTSWESSRNMTIWEILDTHYSPLKDQKKDPRTGKRKPYSVKVRELIRQHNLTRFDELGKEREIVLEKMPLWLMWATWIINLVRDLIDLIDEVEGEGTGEQKKQRVLDAIYERWGAQINALPFGVRHAVKAALSGLVDWIVDASKSLFGDDWNQPAKG